MCDDPCTSNRTGSDDALSGHSCRESDSTPDARSSGSFQLTTPRLTLRLVTAGDTEFVYALYSDWQVARYLLRTPAPFTPDHARAWIVEAQTGFLQRCSYTLVIDDRQTGQAVGMLTLRIPSLEPGYSKTLRDEDHGLGILGYSIRSSAWGRRYASESAQRIVAFAFDDLGLDRLQASPLRINVASRRVLERLGFTIAEADILEEPLHGGAPQLADCYILHRPASKHKEITRLCE